jgi:hypothetical protein
LRRRLTRKLCVAALALAALGVDSEARAAAPVGASVVDLAPFAGYDSWSATNQFLIAWNLVPLADGPAPTAYAYRFLDPAGQPIGPEFRSPAVGDRRVPVAIPLAPGQETVPAGRYGFELWLENGDADSPHASTTVRFDATRPAPAQVLAPEGWIRAGDRVVLQIEPPAGPQPPSGIRGFAVQLDHGSGSGPCGGGDLCDPSEVDLAGEAGGTVSLGPLAEEVNVARAVTVSGSGMSSPSGEGIELRVDGTPPRVGLEGVPGGWSNSPVAIAARAVDELSGMSPSGPAGAVTAIAVDGSVATVAAGERAATVVHGEGVHEVGAYARDAVGNLSQGGEVSEPPPSARVRIDESLPRVAFAAPQDPAEPERIVAVVTDSLSGPDPERGSIALRPTASSQPFEPIPTRAAAGRLTALWDSDSYPPGSYELRATAYDLAGNRVSTVLREDGTGMVLTNPLKTPTALASGFGGRQLVWHRCRRSGGELRCHRQLIGPFERRPGARSVGYGRGVPVGGRLTSTAGLPLVGLAVIVTEIFDAGSAPSERQTTVATDADGLFLAHLPPGPSRRIEVGFNGNRVLTRSGGRELRLGVRAAVRLRSSTATAAIGGAPVTFSGVVAHNDAKIPATGLPVELQFRLPGTSWSEFRTVQTGPDGRFRYPYAFSDDDSRGVRFQFRAHLAAQPGWPFEPGTSRPIAVTGR